MSSVWKVFAGLLLGVLVLAAMGGAALTGVGLQRAVMGGASSSGAAATPSPGTGGTTSPSAGSTPSDVEYYVGLLEQNVASRLGLDKAKLEAALTGAVNDTVDQAVNDGKLSQVQAALIKTAAANGLAGLINLATQEHGNGRVSPLAPGTPGRMMGVGFGSQSLDAAARAIGITADQLKSEMSSGKSIAQVAQAHNVDIVTVKSAVLGEIKSSLDSAVAGGQLTQAKAASEYQAATKNADSFLNATGGKYTGPNGGRGGMRGMGGIGVAFQAVTDAAARALGITTDQLRTEISSGQSLNQIAQAHNVDPGSVKNAILTSVKGELDAAVQSGKLTQGAADTAYAVFSGQIDQLMNGSFRMPMFPGQNQDNSGGNN